MAKFYVIYYAPPEAMKMMETATPEEKQKGMEPWRAWMEKCGDKLVDGGAPLVGGQLVLQDGSVGPARRNVSGYSVLEVDGMAEAIALVDGHPHLTWTEGCELEVHMAVPMNG